MIIGHRFMEEIALTMPERLLKVTFTSSNYDNAYWNGSVMTYGDEAELILIFLHQLMLPHTK
jgi:hypothetical protein